MTEILRCYGTRLNPDACSASGDDRSKKDPSQQAEEPRSGNQVASSQPPAESTGYPRRERRPPEYLNDYVTDLDESSIIDADQALYCIDYFYKVSAFPLTYQEAIESPESENWKAAIKEGMHSLAENNTFTLTTVGRNSVGGRWVYTIKEGSDGAKTYKS